LLLSLIDQVEHLHKSLTTMTQFAYAAAHAATMEASVRRGMEAEVDTLEKELETALYHLENRRHETTNEVELKKEIVELKLQIDAVQQFELDAVNEKKTLERRLEEQSCGLEAQLEMVEPIMRASLLELERLREELDAQVAKSTRLEERVRQLHAEVTRLGGSGSTMLAKSETEAFRAASALAGDVKFQQEMFQAYEALQQMETRIEAKIRVDTANEVEREVTIILEEERRDLADKAGQLMGREIELYEAERKILDGFTVGLDSFCSMSDLCQRPQIIQSAAPAIRDGTRAILADTTASATSWREPEEEERRDLADKAGQLMGREIELYEAERKVLDGFTAMTVMQVENRSQDVEDYYEDEVNHEATLRTEIVDLKLQSDAVRQFEREAVEEKKVLQRILEESQSPQRLEAPLEMADRVTAPGEGVVKPVRHIERRGSIDI